VRRDCVVLLFGGGIRSGYDPNMTPRLHIRSRHVARLVALAFLPILPAFGQQNAIAIDHQLAAQIDELFVESAKGDTSGAAIDLRVRQIFSEHGVVTDKLVGEEVGEEYVFLLSHEPLSFVEQVLPILKRAADAGEIYRDGYIYVEATVRRRRIRQKFSDTPTNPQLQAEIERLIKADQGVRQVRKKTWSPKKMQVTDRADGIIVREILAKYGLPTFALVGPRAAEGFADVIQHQPLALQREVLPQMKAKAAEGQIDPEHYAMLLDRVESSSHRPQTYGENFVCTPKGKFEPSPIADPQNVDRRRAELGLMPLALYKKLLRVFYGRNFCARVSLQNKHAAAMK
jgi:hypothetical protein